MHFVGKPKPRGQRDPKEYTIGIVCALENEAIAVLSAFDNVFSEPEEHPATQEDDLNTYTFGTIGRHYVVLAMLPSRSNGANAANSVSGDMRRTFSIKLCLVVGVCGIVPFVPEAGGEAEAIMGDVLVSFQIKQYDYGKEYPTGFKVVELPEKQQERLRRAEAFFGLPQHRAQFQNHVLPRYLLQLDQDMYMWEFGYPGYVYDDLYDSRDRHKHSRGCRRCDENEYCERAVKKHCEELGCSGSCELLPRERIDDLAEELGYLHFNRKRIPRSISLDELDKHTLGLVLPKVFFGTMASGNKVMKHGEMRDEVAEKRGVIGFEMEAAGVAEHFPTVVIKAACDYADSHKNKAWQPYACMTAAACAKAFLHYTQMGIPGNYKDEDEDEIEPRSARRTDRHSGRRRHESTVHNQPPANLPYERPERRTRSSWSESDEKIYDDQMPQVRAYFRNRPT